MFRRPEREDHPVSFINQADSEEYYFPDLWQKIKKYGQDLDQSNTLDQQIADQLQTITEIVHGHFSNLETKIRNLFEGSASAALFKVHTNLALIKAEVEESTSSDQHYIFDQLLAAFVQLDELLAEKQAQDPVFHQRQSLKKARMAEMVEHKERLNSGISDSWQAFAFTQNGAYWQTPIGWLIDKTPFDVARSETERQEILILSQKLGRLCQLALENEDNYLLDSKWYKTDISPQELTDIRRNRINVLRDQRGKHSCEVDSGCNFTMHGNFALNEFIFPAGIIHYMMSHDYIPPTDFQNAVDAAYLRAVENNQLDEHSYHEFSSETFVDPRNGIPFILELA